MNIWHDIATERVNPQDFYAVIEIPKGCKVKYELDKETGMLPVASPTKCRKSCGSVLEANTLRNDSITKRFRPLAVFLFTLYYSWLFIIILL